MINFFIIAVFILLGAFSKRLVWLPSSTSLRLTQFVIFVCLPSIVLLNVPRMTLQPALLLPALTPWGGIALCGLLVLLAARVWAWSKATTGCMLMVSCFANSSFFGFPMVNAFWGEAGLPYAIIYDLMGSFLSLAIVGNIILAVYSGEEKFSWLRTLKKVVTFPPFIAIVFAILFAGWKIPQVIQDILQVISLLLIPSTMMLVGMHMSLAIPSQVRLPLSIALLLKLIVLPLVVWGIVQSLNVDATSNSFINQVTIFEAAMPPMVTASVLAIHAKLEPKLAASAVGIGLILSCVTLPLWYLVLK